MGREAQEFHGMASMHTGFRQQTLSSQATMVYVVPGSLSGVGGSPFFEIFTLIGPAVPLLWGMALHATGASMFFALSS
ncbi:MAG: hypothetical protein JMM78_00155 [Candidatus Xiphinematobacter sp.]|nr:MAG: hypothetical protein JMM78_00155 [Candidatus Xiphinematobacter sp.]